MKFKDFVTPGFMDAFTKLANMELPVKTTYKISKIQKIVKDEFAKFDEMRVSIIKKYAELHEAGNVKLTEDKQGVVFPAENVEKFTADFNELLEIEFEVQKISIDELSSATLTSNELIALDALITE